MSLARYLDYRLQRLTANGRLVLPQIRIGSADLTPTVITAHARITAIQIDIQPGRLVPGSRVRAAVARVTHLWEPRRGALW